MVISFCGHSDYVKREGDNERIVEAIRSIAGNNEVTFFSENTERLTNLPTYARRAIRRYAGMQSSCL